VVAGIDTAIFGEHMTFTEELDVRPGDVLISLTTPASFRGSDIEQNQGMRPLL
jgi:hypothetical protein